MDVISEIIDIEKQAEQIVADAERQSEEIIAEAKRKIEQEKIRIENEKTSEVDRFHNELKTTAKDHISHTNTDSEAKRAELDRIMSENRDKWVDEIFCAVISV